MLYFICIPIFVLLYIGALFLLRFFKNTMITNLVFCLCIVIPYICLMLIVLNSVGPNDWNFLNTLPTANVSPFMFAICPIYLVLPKKIKPYFFLLTALLSVGMFLSPIMSFIYNGSINYKFHPHFVLDYFSHFMISLWGVYLVQTHQCEVKIKNALISGSLIVGVAIIMMILNVIFDKAFFGLSLNGKYSIYNNVLVDNSYLSALIYFSGLVVVLVLGFLYQKLLLKVFKKEQISEK